MEEKQIKAVRNWPEPQSVHDIQVFLRFANFYQRFIQGFSRLAASLISVLKTTSATGLAASVEIKDGNLEKNGQEVQVKDQNEKEPTQKSRKGQKMAKSKKWIHAKKTETSRARNLNSQLEVFLITDAKRAFIKLRQTFIKAPILNHFDSERYIRIETGVLGYAIGRVLSQLTSDTLGR